MRPSDFRTLALPLALALAIGLHAVPLLAQDTPAPSSAAVGSSADRSRLWLVLGGSTTTARGDCQEDCPSHGTGAYLHTGGVLADIGYRVNPQMDAGFEVLWVPATTTVGDEVRSTFILGTAQYRLWRTHGFFLKAGMGMGFLHNFVYDSTGAEPPVTSKALGLALGGGWAFRRSNRLGVQVYGTQHVAALGDFQVGGTPIENLMANFWSVGAAVVVR